MATTKKKILVFSSTYPRWPNDTSPPFVHELSKRLTDDFDIIVLAPHYPGAKTKEVLEKVKVIRFRYFAECLEILAGETSIIPTLREKKYLWLILPFFLVSGFLHLLYLVRKHKIEIIHAHWLFPQGFQAALTSKLTQTPFIVTSHGADIFATQGPTWFSIKKWVCDNAATVTAVSQAIKNEIHAKLSSTRTEVIPMGVDSQIFSPQKRDDSLRKRYNIPAEFLLFTGRLSEKKGVKYLIEAMPRVTSCYPHAKLLIVGKGELEKDLKEMTRRLGLDETIFFTGPLPNQELPALYATADLFIAPSTKTNDGDIEGFGLTFVEASMCGSIIIGSKVGGICDIITEGETGFLVEDKNPTQLAETIIYILGNKTQLAQISQQARDSAKEQFDWSVIATKYANLLASP